MSDDLEPLLEDDRLQRLLAHYHTAGEADREAWHDRVMEWEGGRDGEIVRWHGLLLAAAWLEQNTGQALGAISGRVPGCYRVTPAGRQALKRALATVSSNCSGIRQNSVGNPNGSLATSATAT